MSYEHNDEKGNNAGRKDKAEEHVQTCLQCLNCFMYNNVYFSFNNVCSDGVIPQ